MVFLGKVDVVVRAGTGWRGANGFHGLATAVGVLSQVRKRDALW